MTVISLHIENEGVQKLMRMLGAKGLPGLSQSIRRAANFVQTEWVTGVNASHSKDGWKNHYVNAIHMTDIRPLSVTVTAEGTPFTRYAKFVESGVPRRDMKPSLINGPHSRQGKGGRYNIIFMRKFTPGSKSPQQMSPEVYARAKKLDFYDVKKRYRVTGVGSDIDMGGGTVKRKTYTRGKSLPRGEADNMGGLVKTGSRGQTQYGTFRVVSWRSPANSWIYPQVPATPVFQPLLSRIRGATVKMMQTGLAMDIEAGVKVMQERVK